MGEVTVQAVAAWLVLTGHPLQRCGARAVAELGRVSDAEEVTHALDAVADTLARAVVRAAAAASDAVAYDWCKVLFALYPNSPATHSKRNRDPGELGKVIGQLRTWGGSLLAMGHLNFALSCTVTDVYSTDRFPEAFGEIGLYSCLAQDLRGGRGRPA